MAESSKKSAVWKFMTKEASNEAKCKLCRGSYAYAGGCTSTFRAHLLGQQPTECVHALNQPDPSVAPQQQTVRAYIMRTFTDS